MHFFFLPLPPSVSSRKRLCEKKERKKEAEIGNPTRPFSRPMQRAHARISRAGICCRGFSIDDLALQKFRTRISPFLETALIVLSVEKLRIERPSNFASDRSFARALVCFARRGFPSLSLSLGLVAAYAPVSRSVDKIGKGELPLEAKLVSQLTRTWHVAVHRSHGCTRIQPLAEYIYREATKR